VMKLQRTINSLPKIPVLDGHPATIAFPAPTIVSPLFDAEPKSA
jgi:hypothetical protein